MFPDLRRVVAYDHWANSQLLEAIASVASLPDRPMKLLAHIVAAGWLWHDRVAGLPQRCPVWPDWDVEELRPQLDPLRDGWLGVLQRTDPAVVIAYTNSRGESFRSTFDEIATHLMLHGSYHRGQIAAALKAAGIEPPYTDYIHAVRQKFV